MSATVDKKVYSPGKVTLIYKDDCQMIAYIYRFAHFITRSDGGCSDANVSIPLRLFFCMDMLY